MELMSTAFTRHMSEFENANNVRFGVYQLTSMGPTRDGKDWYRSISFHMGVSYRDMNGPTHVPRPPRDYEEFRFSYGDIDGLIEMLKQTKAEYERQCKAMGAKPT